MKHLESLRGSLDLDGNGTEGGDSIKGSIAEAVVGVCWIPFPNCGCSLDCTDIGDMLHHIQISELDNMAEAPDAG